MKLSIIVCVYNTEPWRLEKCLRSLTKSTLSHPEKIGRADIEREIILFDDGSDIDYSNLKDKFPVRYFKTENNGILKARISALKLAEGDYVAFCDSDDTVSFNYHLPMLLKAESECADIVINDWAFDSPSGLTVCKTDTTVCHNISASDENVLKIFLAQEGKEHSYFVLWNKIYKKDVLWAAAEKTASETKDFDRYNYSEDVLLNFFAFKNAKKLENVHTGYYFYHIHDSQSVTVASEERLRTQIRLMSHTLAVMCREVYEKPEYLTHLRRWQVLMSRAHYSHAKASGYPSLYHYIRESYKTDKLKKSTYSDERCYLLLDILPQNFEKIDNALLLFYLDASKHVNIIGKCAYVTRSLKFVFDNCEKKEKGSLTVIKAKRPPLGKRLRACGSLMRVARILFPKGSRIRKFLKNKL